MVYFSYCKLIPLQLSDSFGSLTSLIQHVDDFSLCNGISYFFPSKTQTHRKKVLSTQRRHCLSRPIVKGLVDIDSFFIRQRIKPTKTLVLNMFRISISPKTFIFDNFERKLSGTISKLEYHLNKFSCEIISHIDFLCNMKCA